MQNMYKYYFLSHLNDTCRKTMFTYSPFHNSLFNCTHTLENGKGIMPAVL